MNSETSQKPEQKLQQQQRNGPYPSDWVWPGNRPEVMQQRVLSDSHIAQQQQQQIQM